MSNAIIGILGPTASGKTKLAAEIAYALNAEIVSLDSRQVYKELNLGVGKDLVEYEIGGKKIPYHLIDIVSLNEQYHLHQFKIDFEKAYTSIRNKNKITIACGGTGLYFDVLLHHKPFTAVPVRLELREELEKFSLSELKAQLSKLDRFHSFDMSTKKRLIRAIEIASDEHYLKFKSIPSKTYDIKLFGLKMEKNKLNEKIDHRLRVRLEKGLIEEVDGLLRQGFSYERIMYLGLEYKFVCMYLKKEISYDDLFNKLSVAIHQFSKRQMTYFRKLEKDGHEIFWGNDSQIKECILKVYRQA